MTENLNWICWNKSETVWNKKKKFQSLSMDAAVSKWKCILRMAHFMCYKTRDVWRSPHVVSKQFVMNFSMNDRALLVKLFSRKATVRLQI